METRERGGWRLENAQELVLMRLEMACRLDRNNQPEDWLSSTYQLLVSVVCRGDFDYVSLSGVFYEISRLKKKNIEFKRIELEN